MTVFFHSNYSFYLYFTHYFHARIQAKLLHLLVVQVTLLHLDNRPDLLPNRYSHQFDESD